MTGRELDARVAEEVMGWDRRPTCHGYDAWWNEMGWNHPVARESWSGPSAVHCAFTQWEPSRSYNDAWEVWEKLVSEDSDGWAIFSREAGAVTVEFFGEGYMGDRESGAGDFSVDGPFPRAVCEAALKAVAS